MNLLLAEIATHIPASIGLFEKYGLNYYQDGKKSLRQACEEKKLVFSEIDKELGNLPKNSQENYLMTFGDMEIDHLAELISTKHHSNEEEVLEIIHKKLLRVIASHSDISEYQVLHLSAKKFQKLKEALTEHCRKEDLILFPQLRKLSNLKRKKHSPELHAIVETITNLIHELEEEHSASLILLSEIESEISELAIKHPSGDLDFFLKGLKEFEYDFHLHLHIENNILFHKFEQLREQLEKRKHNGSYL
jgi:regulator of cell morphogenesis and NO signaling